MLIRNMFTGDDHVKSHVEAGIVDGLERDVERRPVFFHFYTKTNIFPESN